jgi:hypothetical protein
MNWYWNTKMTTIPLHWVNSITILPVRLNAHFVDWFTYLLWIFHKRLNDYCILHLFASEWFIELLSRKTYMLDTWNLSCKQVKEIFLDFCIYSAIRTVCGNRQLFFPWRPVFSSKFFFTCNSKFDWFIWLHWRPIYCKLQLVMESQSILF